MCLSPPASLSEVATDGFFEQAGVDELFRGAHSIEFSGPPISSEECDAEVSVRLLAPRKDLQGIRVAVLRDGQWTWRTSRGANLDVAEMHGTLPYHPDLIRAARTLFGHVPVVCAPHKNDSWSVVALLDATPQPSLKLSLTAGLANLRDFSRTSRALKALSVFRETPMKRSAEQVQFADGTTLWFKDSLPYAVTPTLLTLADMWSDAFYTAVEHELLFRGQFPDAQVQLDLNSDRAHVVSSYGNFRAESTLIAVIEHDQWVWSWAHPTYAHSALARRAHQLRQCGLDHGIIPLVAPSMPYSVAQQLGLAQAISPVSDRWVTATAELGPHRAVVGLKAPELTLPSASEAALSAVVSQPLPNGISPRRALNAYTAHRKVPISGDALIAPDTSRPIYPKGFAQ